MKTSKPILTLDVEKFITNAEVDQAISSTKDLICHKLKLQGSIREQKKETNAAYNEQLKEIREELDNYIATIDELNRKRLELEGTRIALAKGSNGDLTKG